MQVVVPSVSCAAVLQRRAGTILVDPSEAGRDIPTVELGASSATPCTEVGAGGADCPVMGGGGAVPVLGGEPTPAIPLGAPTDPEGTAFPWARANPTGRITASRPRVMTLGPRIFMGFVPGFGLNRHRECLVPAIFGPVLDFRGDRLPWIALRSIQAPTSCLGPDVAWPRRRSGRLGPCFLWPYGHNVIGCALNV